MEPLDNIFTTAEHSLNVLCVDGCREVGIHIFVVHLGLHGNTLHGKGREGDDRITLGDEATIWDDDDDADDASHGVM